MSSVKHFCTRMLQVGCVKFIELIPFKFQYTLQTGQAYLFLLTYELPEPKFVRGHCLHLWPRLHVHVRSTPSPSPKEK